MTKTKYLKAECGQCRGHIEFPVDAVGMTVDCPHCGKPTELLLAAPPDEALVPRRTIVWTVVTVLILILGAVAVMVALNLTEKRAARQKAEAAAKALAAAKASEPKAPPEPEDPAVKAGFQARPVRLEKMQGSSLTYAVGTLINTTDRQRFGVKIELDLFDEAGKKVGTAKDYQQLIEPHGQWQFKALCVDAKSKSAKVASIKEDQ
jgi:hypothetical protein